MAAFLSVIVCVEAAQRPKGRTKQHPATATARNRCTEISLKGQKDESESVENVLKFDGRAAALMIRYDYSNGRWFQATRGCPRGANV